MRKGFIYLLSMRYLAFIFILFLTSCGVKKSLENRPDLTGIELIDTVRVQQGEEYYRLGNNSLQKNKHGLWELYVEGNPLERGLAIGSLSQDLLKKQEKAFMGKLDDFVDSPQQKKFLSKVVKWYNRKMYLHIPEEYKQEIYGISRFNSHDYDEFAKPYVLSLYLHGAHDIGHALSDLMLVGCTSFAAWDEHTENGQLLIGRNFDFYAGDTFNEEKIIEFFNPDVGYKFMMYSWPGFIGSVSGMNEHGLTVTINAGKSKIPLIAKTPISLVTREILQYAKTTEDAIAIAKKREVFVSESIMVGSAEEHKAILIEVSPKNFGVYEVENSSELICSNHFQSEAYAGDSRNQSAIKNSHTQQRYDRMKELLAENEQLSPKKAAAILRDKKGVKDTALGFGNELAINQLLAHHGIIFQPEERKVWVSSSPYQLGAFVAYDLDEVFAEFEKGDHSLKGIDSLLIAEDPFLNSEAFKNYELYRKESRVIQHKIQQEEEISEEKLVSFIALNPDFWKAYYWVGEYYFQQKNYKKAIVYYKQALQREVTTLPDVEMLEKRIKKSYRKI